MIKILTISFIAIFLIPTVTDVFSLDNEIGLTLKTEKANYNIGEPVIISGNVLLYPEFLEVDVFLQIWKNGSIMDIGKISPDQEGEFSYVLNTDAEKWTQSRKSCQRS